MSIEVGIIMGSDSDLLVMSEAAKICEYFGVEYEVTVVSAHRTPERLFKYSKNDKIEKFPVVYSKGNRWTSGNI